MATIARPGRLKPAETSWDDGFPLAPSRRVLAGILLSFANLMVVLDLTIANVSVPHIAGNLGATLDQGTWVITSYAVAEAICVPLSGWLANRFGAVRTFMYAMLGFAVFSLLCGLSISLPMLVICRIGQGLCGGPIMPMAQTLVVRIFPPQDLPRAMAFWTLTVMVGPAVGPIVGGFISDQFSWHWIFLINVPIGIACAIAAWTLLRPAETERVKLPIDRIGLALLITWIGALQLMLDTGRDRDWFDDPFIIALAVLAAVAFCVFIIWELTEEHPIVDLRVFRHRPFTMCVLTLSLVYGAYFTGVVTVPQWLQTTLGYSATMSGMVTATAAFTAMISSQVVVRMMLKVDPRLLVSLGAAWMGFSFLLRTTWSPQVDMFTIGWMIFIQGFGMPMMMMPLTNMALSAVAQDETASGAGLQNFMRTMSIAVSTALVLTDWSNAQVGARAGMVDTLQTADTQATLAQAGLPDAATASYVSSLVDQQAMTLSILHTFWIGAVAMFASAAFVWLVPKMELTRLKGRNSDAH